MAIVDDRDDILKGVIVEESKTLFDEQKSIENGLDFSEKCSHSSLLARIDAAYALQASSTIRLAI